MKSVSVLPKPSAADLNASSPSNTCSSRPSSRRRPATLYRRSSSSASARTTLRPGTSRPREPGASAAMPAGLRPTGRAPVRIRHSSCRRRRLVSPAAPSRRLTRESVPARGGLRGKARGWSRLGGTAAQLAEPGKTPPAETAPRPPPRQMGSSADLSVYSPVCLSVVRSVCLSMCQATPQGLASWMRSNEQAPVLCSSQGWPSRRVARVASRSK